MHADLAIAGLALTAASVAMVTDLRQRKIYNWLTLPLLAAGPLVQLAVHGWAGLGSSLLGMLAVAGLLFLLSVTAGPGLGGGDLKLLTALGALVGWPLAGWLLLYTGASALVVAVPVMFQRRIVRQTCQNLALNMTQRRLGDRSLSAAAGSLGPRLPFAVCVLMGTLALVLRGPLH